MDLECAKTLSNGFPDRTAYGLVVVPSNQRTPRCDIKMACQKSPVPAYYGAVPFNFTISHNSVNTNSITRLLGLNDGNICTLYLGISVFSLHWVLSTPNPKLGCMRYRAKSFTSVLKCPDVVRPVSYRAHLAKPFSGWEVHLQPNNGTQQTLPSPNIESNRAATALYRFHTIGLCAYSTLQWNLSWETTAMRDHLSWQTMHFRQKDLHFNIPVTEPVARDHLSWQTRFLWPMGWSFKSGSTVSIGDC